MPVADDASRVRAELLRFLEEQGFTFDPIGSSEDLAIGSPDTEFVHRPILVLPRDLLWEYLQEMSDGYGDEPDPLGEALSMTGIHAVEYLTTDHGGGRNVLRALGFRRDRAGRVEFFEDRDVPSGPRRRGRSGELEWVSDL